MASDDDWAPLGSQSWDDRRPVVAYLDMNIWVDMAIGVTRRDARWLSAVDGLQHAVADGQLILPLNSSHYLELWNRSNPDSRADVAALMRDLSGYATLSPIQDIRRLEIDSVVAARMGAGSGRVTASDLLGHGANHAFNSDYGRFRFVASLASPDGEIAEGDAVSAPSNWDDLPRNGAGWEWLNLVGLDDVLRSPGVERTPTHRLGDAFMRNELLLRELLTQVPAARRRLADLVVSDELQSLTDTLNASCVQAGLNPYSLFLENPAVPDPAEAMRTLVRSLPSVDTSMRLRVRKHQDLNHPWDQHDRVDIINLATAVPYCDMVVTERQWAHLVTVSKLAADYGTRVGHGIAGAEALVSAVGAASRDIADK